MKFLASNEQKDMYNVMTNNDDDKHFSFIAPAGCGKTSTILYFMDCLSEQHKLLYLVFNQIMRKEIETRLKYTNSNYNNINKENVEVLTLNGYMRKVLQERVKDVVFDFQNGDFAPTHLKMLIDTMIDTYSINTRSASVTESFNAYSKSFLQNIQPLEDFIKQEELPYVNEAITSDLRDVLLKRGENIDAMPFEEQQKVVKAFYDEMLVSIFKDNSLSQAMPHSIYYRYVYENYGDENLFEGYDFIFVDEAQDVDLVITALLEKSGVKVVKFGDDFQQINAFRGTINSLQDKKSITRYLTMSYRLTPYMALVTSAYLKQQGVKLGFDASKIPEVYGYTRDNGDVLSSQSIKELSFSDYADSTIDSIGSIKVEDNDTYIELMEQKKAVTSSIIGGCVTKFKNSIKEFKADKDYSKFLSSVMEYTNYISDDGLLGDKPKDYNQLLAQEINDSNKMGETHSLLFNIAKAYGLKFSKKEKVELLQNSDYAFLARNNNKVIDSAYNFIQKIPFEPLSDFALFNVRLNSTLNSKFDGVARGNWTSLSVRETAILMQGMESLIHPTLNMSINDTMKLLDNNEMAVNILSTLLKNPEKADALVDIKVINVGDNKFSPSDFGIDGETIKKVLKNAVTQTKKRLGVEEATAVDIRGRSLTERQYNASAVRSDWNNALGDKNSSGEKADIRVQKEAGEITTWRDFVRLDSYMLNNFSLEDIENINNPFINNFFKYCEIKQAEKFNPNLTLVGEGGVNNVYFSTVHQAKGLEFHNVYLANDIYPELEGVEVDIKDEIAEFNLAYVGMTRTKKTLAIESGSDLFLQVERAINNGYKREFVSKGVIVEEELAPIPKFSAMWQDSITKEINSKEVSFFENSTFPNYKDITILSRNSGEVADINVFDSSTSYEQDLLKTYLKPIESEDKEDIMFAWEQEKTRHLEDNKEIIMEAESVF
jgi:UvrD-like helicase C-terminal domain/UvrD/REP helicase N-terminal domain